jgi:hypothetical protein
MQQEGIGLRQHTARNLMGWKQHLYQAVLLGLFVTFLINIS